jgi:hypothetical protein
MFHLVLFGVVLSSVCRTPNVPLLNPLQELEGGAGDLSIKCVQVKMLAFASLNGAWDWCFLVTKDVLHNMLLQTIVIDKVTIDT